MPPALQGDNICAFIRAFLWHLFRLVGYLRHQQQVDFRPFDLESGVRVTCDVVYLCAIFFTPRPLCSQVRPMYAKNVRRQTDSRQTKASLNASALWGRRHINRSQRRITSSHAVNANELGTCALLGLY